ncbi:MAG: hypothetical protein J07HX64_00011 [halophilic archaeon J07HX64]|nr:MAG: hypothetical protein J07HX64_00011 [halophilic archaeon J07HX64]
MIREQYSGVAADGLGDVAIEGLEKADSIR